jgi:hypothetical protein
MGMGVRTEPEVAFIAAAFQNSLYLSGIGLLAYPVQVGGSYQSAVIQIVDALSVGGTDGRFFQQVVVRRDDDFVGI